MSTKTRPYRLTTPCTNCPFRSDLAKYLRPERAQEIAQALYDGGDFPCHKTTVDVEDAEGQGDRVRGPESAACAGALITMEKEGYSNQMVRIAESMGLYDPTKIDMAAPVYDSLAEWVASYRTTPTVTRTYPDGTSETLDLEHCGVVAQDCEDPPGWSAGGGVVTSTEAPQCDPFEGCGYCGQPMCGACDGGTDDDMRVCVQCKED